MEASRSAAKHTQIRACLEFEDGNPHQTRRRKSPAASFKEYSLHDGAQPARPSLAVDSLASDGAECFLRHGKIDPLHLEQLPILLEYRVLGFGQDALERGLVEVLKRRYDRKAADEFRDQAVLEQILRLDVAENLALLSILRRDDLGAKAD